MAIAQLAEVVRWDWRDTLMGPGSVTMSMPTKPGFRAR